VLEIDPDLHVCVIFRRQTEPPKEDTANLLQCTLKSYWAQLDLLLVPETAPPEVKVRGIHLNTDEGFIIEVRNALTTVKKAELRECLRKANDSQFDDFCGRISMAVSMYRAHKSGRKIIPDAREQQRYRKKLDTKLRKFVPQCDVLIELLEQAPVALRRAARSAGSDVNKLQSDLIAMLQALQEVSGSKDTVEPEREPAVRAIAFAFEEAFGAPPVVRALTDKETVGPDAPLEHQFVPAVAILLDLTPDHVYRLSKQFLSP
jgi:hypothetical protein